MLIKVDEAVAWLCYVLCNERANDALKVLIETLATRCIVHSYFISWNDNICLCDWKEETFVFCLQTHSAVEDDALYYNLSVYRQIVKINIATNLVTSMKM